MFTKYIINILGRLTFGEMAMVTTMAVSFRRRRMFESCHCWCNTLRADQQSKQDRHYSYLVYHRLSVGLLLRKRGLNPCMFCVVPLRSAVFLTFCVTCLDLVSVQFSSRWYLCARKSPYALHPVSEVSPTLPLKQFQCSSGASSFHASLLQAIDGVMSLALCPQVVSQASQHFRSSENKPLVRVALPASLSARSFPFTPA